MEAGPPTPPELTNMACELMPLMMPPTTLLSFIYLVVLLDGY
jgi:hypothetical protein